MPESQQKQTVAGPERPDQHEEYDLGDIPVVDAAMSGLTASHRDLREVQTRYCAAAFSKRGPPFRHRGVEC